MRLKIPFGIILATACAFALIASLNAVKLKSKSAVLSTTKTEARPLPNRAEPQTPIHRPEKTPSPAPGKIGPLTPEEQARFEAGKELYTITCGTCHQPTGLGQEGLAPPLLGSEWVIGSEQRLIRISLHGLRGP